MLRYTRSLQQLVSVAMIGCLISALLFFILKELEQHCLSLLLWFLLHASRPSRHFDPLNISVPFSRSSSSFHSFVPSASRLWNSLPHSTKALSTCCMSKQWISRCCTLRTERTVLNHPLMKCMLLLQLVKYAIILLHAMEHLHKQLENLKRSPVELLSLLWFVLLMI